MPTVTKDGPSALFIQNEAQYKAQNPKLTSADIQVYNINKKNYFAGTIAVCVIYGVFSLVLLLLTIFSPSGSVLITETYRTFTITFIIGMIVATLLLTLAVATLKPRKLTQNPYDAQMCPDYWTFKKTDVTNRVYMNATDTNRYLMQYQCENPDNVTNPPTLARPADSDKIIGNSTNAADKVLYGSYNNLKSARDTTLSPNNTSPVKLDCSQVFPLLLNSINSSDTTINNVPNALACSYAEQCRVPWSAMCPNAKLGNTNKIV
jgi:hypothetical protein